MSYHCTLVAAHLPGLPRLHARAVGGAGGRQRGGACGRPVHGHTMKLGTPREIAKNIMISLLSGLIGAMLFAPTRHSHVALADDGFPARGACAEGSFELNRRCYAVDDGMKVKS